MVTSVDEVVLWLELCAARSDELHEKELEIISMIYCHVVASAELIAMTALA